jgi:Kef-type K+ transport system membrane component KefB
MTTTELFLIALLIIYAVPYAVWRLVRLEPIAPLAIVQIVGGIALGPGVLGALFPEVHKLVFNPQVITALSGIAWWGVMMFVFLAGLELDLKDAWINRRETAVTAGLALMVPLALGAAAAFILLATGDGWAGPRGTKWQAVPGIGMACAVTALPILVLLLEKLDILHTPLGQRVLRYASLDDVAIWGVLALILAEWQRLGRQAAFIAMFAGAAFFIRMLMKRISEADRWFAGLLWLIAVALAADSAGLHYMVGAFLAGVVIDAAWFDRARLDSFRNAILLAMMPVFFLSTGLRTGWDMGGVSVFAAAALLLAAAVAGKLGGVYVAGQLLGWRAGETAVIGWLLQTKALIMIIFANILLDKQIISSAMFTALLLMAVASTVLTVPMVRGKLQMDSSRARQDSNL